MPQAVQSASAMTGRHNTMVPKRESSKDAPLIEDIRLLGQILGTTIREQEGDEVFERIEKVRRLSVAFERDADEEAGRALDALLRALTSEEAVLVVRAFSYFSHLANIAEDRPRAGRDEN
jgi:phosphoenolpyruvate carboxylase